LSYLILGPNPNKLNNKMSTLLGIGKLVESVLLIICYGILGLNILDVVGIDIYEAHYDRDSAFGLDLNYKYFMINHSELEMLNVRESRAE